MSSQSGGAPSSAAAGAAAAGAGAGAGAGAAAAAAPVARATGGLVTAHATAFVPNAAAITKAAALYERVCAGHDIHLGKTLSTRERDAKGLATSTLVYGEIKFEPFAVAFQKIRQLYGGLQRRGGVFVDVGAGTGKPAFAAALLHDWDSCRGVEILSGLHGASLELLKRWRSDEVQVLLTDAQREIAFDFVLGDARKVEWSGADCLFMNSTCFDEPLMVELASVADNMRVGSFAVTFTKRLPSAKWLVCESEVAVMSWGTATVFIHKKALPASSALAPRW